MTILLPLIMLFVGPLELKPITWISISSIIISHLLVQLMKRVFKRIRPYLSMPRANVYGFLFKDHSFPSGHSAAIFALLTPYIIYDAFLAPHLLLVALFVALSRVVLGVHYPSDVLAGSLLGIATGMSFFAFYY